MTSISPDSVRSLASQLVLDASCGFGEDKTRCYKRCIEAESNARTKWVMEQILENVEASFERKSPLCDDTGIPHLVLEVGPGFSFDAGMLDAIEEGVREGLNKLPGRPMAVRGDDWQRLQQSEGMYEDPGMVEPAPVLLRKIDEPTLRLHLLMQGGGPAIRGKTLRIFHRHDARVVLDEIVSWSKKAVSELGCSPCVLAIGVGRSNYEATAMMTFAQIDANFDNQTEMERYVTERINEAGTGALGLGGDTSVLATFMKVGPARASGVRVVCLRPCCCFEPRHASIDLCKEGMA